MGSLIGHMWFWLLAAFVIGAVIAWYKTECDRA
jgi:hypothetical protein